MNMGENGRALTEPGLLVVAQKDVGESVFEKLAKEIFREARNYCSGLVAKGKLLLRIKIVSCRGMNLIELSLSKEVM